MSESLGSSSTQRCDGSGVRTLNRTTILGPDRSGGMTSPAPACSFRAVPRSENDLPLALHPLAKVVAELLSGAVETDPDVHGREAQLFRCFLRGVLF